jgi:hypothetical protein
MVQEKHSMHTVRQDYGLRRWGNQFAVLMWKNYILSVYTLDSTSAKCAG